MSEAFTKRQNATLLQVTPCFITQTGVARLQTLPEGRCEGGKMVVLGLAEVGTYVPGEAPCGEVSGV